MVRFVFGPAGCGKTEYIMSEIEAVLAGSDRRVFLLVPEQHTVATESRLARRFDPRHFLRLEATNFTRLSDSVSRRVGGISYTHLTQGARMLILWRSMMSVWQGLHSLSAVTPGDEVKLLPGVYSAYRELTLSGVSPGELEEAAQILRGEGEDVLSGKAHDMAMISAAAAEAMSEDFSDVADPIMKLAASAADSGIFRDAALFVDSFYSLTGAELAALGQLIRCCGDVTVTIPMESPSDAGIHLDGVREFYRQVAAAAIKYGSTPEAVMLTGNHRSKTSELAELSAHLWDHSYRGGEQELPSVPESVELYTAADRYAEAEALCARIMSLVRRGCRYSDIAVVCGDVSRLRGVTDRALRAHGIPAFISEPTGLTSSPAVRLILSLLSIVGSWRREDVISAVKTGLTPLRGEEAWAFEAYTETWNIRGRRMFSTPWSMNPDGYSEVISDRGIRTLNLANDGRDRLIPHLERFSDAFSGGKATVSAICEAIVEFFDRTGAYLRMEERAAALEAEGAADDGARERLVWREICAAFDTMAEIIGSSPVTPSGFTALFRHVIADADTGAIPTGVDQVTVASAAGLRCDGVRHVILLGAVDGELPVVPTEDFYFTDTDRELLAEAGVKLGESTALRSSEELFRFSRAVSQASESLTVFIPRLTDGSPCRPSEGVRRICALLSRDALDIPDYFEAAGVEAIFDESSLSDAMHRSGKQPAAPQGGLQQDCSVGSDTARAVFGEKMKLSQTRLNDFVRCPFMYYCKHVLRLEEDVRAELSALSIGNFVHSVLEAFFLAVGDKPLPIPMEEAEAVIDSVIERYRRATAESGGTGDTDGRIDYLFRRLRKQASVFIEVIMDEMFQSTFKMYASELPIGSFSEEDGRAVPPAIVFTDSDGGSVTLHGKLDRLDVYRAEDGNTYIRVIDYKTGSTKFSYKDVYRGLNIQLLLYLFAAWRSEGTAFYVELSKDGGSVLPAGAMYLNVSPGEPISPGALTEEEARDHFKSAVNRSGVFCAEREVLDAMDPGFTGRYIPVTLKKDGSFKKGADLLTLEDFGKLYHTMGDTVTAIAAQMKSGTASPTPLQPDSPCPWCAMREVCRKG